jgi:hypothetical protein
MTEELCIHDLAPETCSVCLHGVERRPNPDLVPCRSCGEPILWCVTDKNRKAIPIDPEPDPGGNVIKLRREANGDKIVHIMRRDENAAQPRYNAHWATCPNADQHRRAR